MRSLLCVLILLGTLGASSARADNLEEAKLAFAAGKVAFERGEYEQALSQFQRANLIAPAPSLSYNIGKTYEKMGRYRDAVLAFERYLELAGPPQSDDDRKFQDELKARIDGDRGTPDRPAASVQQPPPPNYPPPQQPPPPNYAPPPPTYYNPYQPYGYNPYAQVQTKAARLASARQKRTKGITSFSIGAAFFVIGLVITVDSALTPHWGGGTSNSEPLNNVYNIIEIVFGVPCLIVGPILIGTGAAGWGKGQSEMNKIYKEPEQSIPGQPAAMIFRVPAIRF